MNSDPRDPRAGPEDALLRLYERTRSGEPPAAVDAAILARARAAVAPRTKPRRWWIPVSVAATALLALSLVVDVARETGPVNAPRPDEARRSEIEPAKVAPPVPAPATEVPSPGPAQPESALLAPPARDAPGDMASTHPGPEPAAGTMREQPRPSAPELRTMRAAPAAATAERAETDSAMLPPEEWLARIEALEAAGRDAEAEREREALEAAYPGWLERHRSTPQ